MIRVVTHERRLRDTGDLLDQFVSEVAGLGPKLGPLLVQPPPSLSLQESVADRLLRELRNTVRGPNGRSREHAIHPAHARRQDRSPLLDFGATASTVARLIWIVTGSCPRRTR